MPDNRGKVWTSAEYAQLLDELACGDTLEKMINAHGRTAYAIVSKLEQLGHITLRGAGYHRIDPDPWILLSVVRQLQEGSR